MITLLIIRSHMQNMQTSTLTVFAQSAKFFSCRLQHNEPK